MVLTSLFTDGEDSCVQSLIVMGTFVEQMEGSAILSVAFVLSCYGWVPRTLTISIHCLSPHNCLHEKHSEIQEAQFKLVGN